MFEISPQLVANLAHQFIHMPPHPDWSGLQASLQTQGFDSAQVFEVMQAIREGNY